LIGRLPAPLIVADPEYLPLVTGAGKQAMTVEDFREAARAAEPVEGFAAPDDVAIVLFTSGTTAQPKAVELGPTFTWISHTWDHADMTHMSYADAYSERYSRMCSLSSRAYGSRAALSISCFTFATGFALTLS